MIVIIEHDDELKFKRDAITDILLLALPPEGG